MRAVMEDELAKLYHGYNVTHSWGCKQNNCLLPTSSGFSLIFLAFCLVLVLQPAQNLDLVYIFLKYDVIIFVGSII